MGISIKSFILSQTIPNTFTLLELQSALSPIGKDSENYLKTHLLDLPLEHTGINLADELKESLEGWNLKDDLLCRILIHFHKLP